MCYLPQYLEKEIRNKVELIRDSKSRSLSLFCQKRNKRAIEKNAQIHSFRIENPKIIVPYSVPKNKRCIKKGIKNISGAFRWGKQNFNPKKFNESFIRNVAGKICPNVWEGGIADYRRVTYGVTISGSEFTPSYPQKVVDIEIPFFENSLREKLTSCNEDPIKQILAAAYAHFHIARIHPFEDCNGRTARTTQDIILDHYGLPAPVIEAGERDIYYKCLEAAVGDWKDKEGIKAAENATKGEGMFYSFIAGKVNVSLDKVLDCIR